jgi:hypothetical protein
MYSTETLRTAAATGFHLSSWTLGNLAAAQELFGELLSPSCFQIQGSNLILNRHLSLEEDGSHVRVICSILATYEKAGYVELVDEIKTRR